MANQPNKEFDNLDKMYREFMNRKGTLEQNVKDAKENIKAKENEIKAKNEEIKKKEDIINHLEAAGITDPTNPARQPHENDLNVLKSEKQLLVNQLNQHRGELAAAEHELKDALDKLKKEEKKVIGNNPEAQMYMDIALAKKYDRKAKQCETEQKDVSELINKLDTLKSIMEQDSMDCNSRGSNDSLENRFISAMKTVRSSKCDIDKNNVEINHQKEIIENARVAINALDPTDPNYTTDKATHESNISAAEVEIRRLEDENKKNQKTMNRVNSDLKETILKRTTALNITPTVYSYEEMNKILGAFISASLQPKLINKMVEDPNHPGTMIPVTYKKRDKNNNIIDEPVKIAEKDADGHTVYEDDINPKYILPKNPSDYSSVFSKARGSLQRDLKDVSKKTDIIQNALVEEIGKHPEIPFDPKSDFLRAQVRKQQVDDQLVQQNAQLQQQNDQLQQQYEQIQQQLANPQSNFKTTDALKNLAEQVAQARNARDAMQLRVNNLPATQTRWYQFITRARERRNARQLNNELQRLTDEYNTLQGRANNDMQAGIIGGQNIDFNDQHIIEQIRNSNPGEEIHLVTQTEASQRIADGQQMQNIQNQQIQIQQAQQQVQQQIQQQEQQVQMTGREPELTDFQKRVKVSPYVQAKLDSLYGENYKKSKKDVQQQRQQPTQGPTR